MKKLLLSFQARQLLALLIIGTCYVTAFQLAQRPLYSIKGGWQLPFAEEIGDDEENDGDKAFPDRPDLALQQDADLTRDPATGRVPTERLLAAARFNEISLKSQAQQAHRTTAQTLSNAPWVERGPSNVAGRLLSLLVDPTDATGNTVWAGSADGGLWKATNASSASIAWTNANSSFNNLAVSALAAEPGSSPLIMYAGTGEGFLNADAVRGVGIFKSTDGGASWAVLPATVSDANFWLIQKIVVHPVTKDVYAATRDGGLYRSTDKGVTWTQVLNTTTTQASVTTRVADIEIAADNTIFVSFGIFTTDGIYRSPTGNPGDWTKLNTLSGSGLPTSGYSRIELACAPSDATRLYAAFHSSATNGVLNLYRSLNGGTTWQVLPKPTDADPGIGTDYTRGQAWYDLPLAVSPSDPNTLWVGGIDLFKTSNGGASTASNVTWKQVTHWYGGRFAGTTYQDVHADQHAIVFPAGSDAKMYFGNDGGFYFSTNPTVAVPTITAGNTGLNVTQFYAVAMHPSSNNYFLAGAQDNGSQQFTAAGINTTTEVTGGDGGYCAIDQLTPANQVTSYVYNNYYRSKNGGSTFPDYFNISDTEGSFINPWDFDSNAKVLYAGYTTNSYLAWTNPLTATSNVNGVSTDAVLLTPALPAGSNKVTFVGISPFTANRIYLGTNNGRVVSVDNAQTTTPTFKTLFTGTSNTSISCVAIDPANENHQLITLSNYGTGLVSVYETTNANAATPTWTAVEGNLPDMPVRWALFDPRNTTRAILATEMGVYTTVLLNGASTAWSVVSNGPKNLRVDMLRYRSGDKLVAAATHGRGLFTSVIFDPSTPLPVTLTSLTAVREAKLAQVRWQTASEQKALRFEVERATNAVDYQRVGSVAAVGTSTSLQSYSFADPTAGSGACYYRLKQVDTDGTFTYSPAVVLAALASGPGPMLNSVYPNPFTRELNLELRDVPTGSVALTLVDAQGRRVWATSTTASSRQLQAEMPATLARGTYLLTVRANGQQATRRVVKE